MWQSSASARTRPDRDGPRTNRTGNPPLKSRLGNRKWCPASYLAPACTPRVCCCPAAHRRHRWPSHPNCTHGLVSPLRGTTAVKQDGRGRIQGEEWLSTALTLPLGRILSSTTNPGPHLDANFAAVQGAPPILAGRALPCPCLRPGRVLNWRKRHARRKRQPGQPRPGRSH